MEIAFELVLDAGTTAVQLALYVLLPIMVVMLGLMRFLDARGVLSFVARIVAPPLKVMGVPGLGVFAALQILLVSFAAPAATLAVMVRKNTSRRQLAATLAMVLTMSQANAVFPLATVGLDVGLVLFTSVVGGLGAAALTFHVLTRSIDESGEAPNQENEPTRAGSDRLFAPLLEGGHEAVQLVLRSLPILVLTLLCVNVLQVAGILQELEDGLALLMNRLGLPGIAVVPIAMKYVAGGAAMTGVTLDLVQNGSIAAGELNRLAGIAINPLDPVGLAVLASAGERVAGVLRYALPGAAVGVLLRTVLHLALA